MPPTWDLDRTAEGVVVRGEIDLGVADAFEVKASAAVMGSAVANFFVDLSDVTFMDYAYLKRVLQEKKSEYDGKIDIA